ncbi:hypothetical protein MAPG_03510, partial [Magnaporthiopsis poae ATCC 64411]
SSDAAAATTAAAMPDRRSRRRARDLVLGRCISRIPCQESSSLRRTRDAQQIFVGRLGDGAPQKGERTSHAAASAGSGVGGRLKYRAGSSRPSVPWRILSADRAGHLQPNLVLPWFPARGRRSVSAPRPDGESDSRLHHRPNVTCCFWYRDEAV